MSDEKKISDRYRELPREEPPRAVDNAILAASRRTVQARPAPLVAPSGRSRWYFPLAAAAVIVLAVAVTVHVDRERPDAEVPSGAVQPSERKEEAAPKQEAAPKPAEAARADRAPARPAPPAAPAPARQAAAPVFAPDPKGEAAPAREARAQRDAGPASAAEPTLGAASPPRSENALDSARAKAVAEAERREAATAAQGARRADEAPRKSAAVLAKVTAEQSPEQWLQGIADLRRQGRHEEADKALAEFRKRYPRYKISEAMLEKVEKK